MAELQRLLLGRLLPLLTVSWAFQQCSEDTGGGFCPTNNTCCPLRRSPNRSGCIPNDLGLEGVCCYTGHDDDNNVTGCGHGYVCGSNQTCVATMEVADPLVQVLPRYHLCSSIAEKPTLLGFEVDDQQGAQLAYYSSHGDITKLHHKIDMILIIIHGAARNADDYYCSGLVSSQLQQRFTNVLVIAPYFPVLNDTLPDHDHHHQQEHILRWNDDGAGGPWRYGQVAMYPYKSVSSFEALERFIFALAKRVPYQQMTIAGHSAGGQFVQRFMLTTRIQDWRLRGVVANPSSFAYLTPYRFYQSQWQVPSSDCSNYNQWEWGLEPGGDYAALWVANRIDELGMDKLTQRFASRTMIYLAGGQDRCNVSRSSDDGWCSSHGLETTCMDMMGGTTRWERHQNYVESLRRLGFEVQRMTVPNVGHDHSLIFNSKEGLRAIYDP